MPFRPKDRPKDRAKDRTRAGDKPGATHEQVERRERFQRAQRESLQPSDDTTVLYGWHPVIAALQNPARRVRKLLATENAAHRDRDRHERAGDNKWRAQHEKQCTAHADH